MSIYNVIRSALYLAVKSIYNAKSIYKKKNKRGVRNPSYQDSAWAIHDKVVELGICDLKKKLSLFSPFCDGCESFIHS